MQKKYINLSLILLLSIFLSSCADEFKRMENAKKLFPKSKVEPSTGIIKEKGYELIAIDTSGQIIAISFYPFSETKISSIRNIR